ncbi:AraC family transcriptional regulator [Tenacibaculum sp. AHE15PA]|uniref:helix-turn-helix domain-containing protein n=1 Tax=unclassified Tenacibaculum TaxID=2635139 RepID=UPI001C4F4CE9|nr:MULTISPECIES: helix-turn-helix domain-containing protein [unclassified Tenacibaculum]QXP73037.1 AraC family transcriptional regulator [Tenacibaculum sp. AHE14PA]QXP76951.1 AraC family transcriptional regulator [Tenacibaculum sp. AHE15PA]
MAPKKTLLFFLFLLTINLSAQEINKDTYKEKILSLSNILETESEARNQVVIIQKMLNLSKKNKDTFQTIRLLHQMGRKSQFLNEYHVSIKSFEKELVLFNAYNLSKQEKEIIDSLKITPIEIIVQLGNSYAAVGETKTALAFYSKSELIASQENLQFYKAVIPVLIGAMNYSAGDYKKALLNYKKGLNRLQTTTEIDERNKNFNSAITITSISDTYIKLKNIDSAKLVLKKAIKQGLDTLNNFIRIGFYSQNAKILIEEKKYSEALNKIKQLSILSHKHDPNSGNYYYYKELTAAYTGLKKYDSAIAVMEKGIEIGLTKTKEFYLVDDYKTLAKTYKKSGNIKKSNEYFEKYVLNQTALEKNKKNIINSFHNKELSSLESEKENQKKTTKYLMITSSSIILLLVLYLLRLSSRKKKDSDRFIKLINKINSLEQQQKIIDTKDKILEEKLSIDINKETFNEILAGLHKVEEQHYYLKQECNSYNIARKIKTNTSYLSKVINTHYQKNFNTYINDLRINYVLLKLKKDSKFRAYAVQSISEEIGYKSTDSFTKYFRKRTGLLPSVYIKKLNSIN